MKTFIKSASLLAICTPVLFSCNNDVEGTLSVDKIPVELSLSVNNHVTRTIPTLATDGTITTSWANGDAVGLYTGNESAVYTTEDAGATWSSAAKLSVVEGTTNTFYGYYPYSANNTDITAINCSVAIDQTGVANFTAGDILRGVNADVAANATVTMNMNHVNALIKIKISGTAAASDIQVALKNVVTNAAFNLTSGTVTVGETTGDVKMHKLHADAAANEYVFIAVIPAQTIASGTKFVEITTGEERYHFSHTADVAVGSNQMQPIAIQVGNAAASMEIDGNFTIGTWVSNEEIGGEAVIVPGPKSLITEAYPATWTSAGLAVSTTPAGWFKAGNSSLSVSDAVISWSGANTNWYNNYIAYRYSGVQQGEKYTLKFKVSAENTPTTEPEGTEPQTELEYKIVVGARSAYTGNIDGSAATSGNWMVPILQDAAGSPLYYRTQNITSTDTEYTYILDFKGLYNGSTTGATIVEAGEELQGAIASGDLFISNITVGSTAKIHSVTLTQLVE